MKPLSEQELREKIQDIFNDCTSGWLITIKNFNSEDRSLESLENEIIDDILTLTIQDRKAHEENIKNIIKMSDKYTFADGTIFVRQRNQGEKTKIKQAIQALIADQMAEYQAQLLKDYKEDIATAVREARIDELEHIISGSEHSDDDFDWYELTKKEYVGTKYYSEVRHLDKDSRIAQLKEGAQE